MPVIKSAGKKMRQAKTKAARNRTVKDILKTKIALFRKKPEKKTWPALMSLLDKVGKKNIFHKNKVSRLKSRLSKLLDK